MIDEYYKLIGLENIYIAWKKFASNKTNKKDVIDYWRHLEKNIFNLHNELGNDRYKHGCYQRFVVCDPKRRIIHKAQIKDRIVHQLLFDYLQPIFEKKFIYHSYASRINKGAHRAVRKLKSFCLESSRNKDKNCWILKGDIKKYFASIDHQVLFGLIKKQVFNRKILELTKIIIKSYEDSSEKGLPLGNLSSQLFANIYLNEFDYFAKHILRLKYYIRYNDDFVIIDKNKEIIKVKIPFIRAFLQKRLLLSLPKEKIVLRKFNWGIDFLGYIILPNGILLRTKTKRRMLKKIQEKLNQYQTGVISFNKLAQSINSYLGALKHCCGFKTRQFIINNIPFLYD